MQFHKTLFFTLSGLLFLASCKPDAVPKPASYLRLEYPDTTYVSVKEDLPYTFEYSKNAKVTYKKNNWVDIQYPNLKATIVITYTPIKNNLRLLFADAEKLTFKHMIKADDIQSTPYENGAKKVYGKMFEVYGNAATQLQFHATDSTKNFITGALYFYVKPNYDSIFPAVVYLKKDVQHLIETLQWKN
jgi:gliding motility-associated lipoprotein GldD